MNLTSGARFAHCSGNLPQRFVVETWGYALLGGATGMEPARNNDLG